MLIWPTHFISQTNQWSSNIYQAPFSYSTNLAMQISFHRRKGFEPSTSNPQKDPIRINPFSNHFHSLTSQQMNVYTPVNFTMPRRSRACALFAGFFPSWQKTLSCLSTTLLSGRRGSLVSSFLRTYVCLEEKDRRRKCQPTWIFVPVNPRRVTSSQSRFALANSSNELRGDRQGRENAEDRQGRLERTQKAAHKQ